MHLISSADGSALIPLERIDYFKLSPSRNGVVVNAVVAQTTIELKVVADQSEAEAYVREVCQIVR
jgi:hypothetical protein